ncbi:NmrA family NAD(P)-binding protein [Nocardia sp. alder85J]|uniref:NmrA family NAD(P)-binding protein n=1 Tax=Nocardia sp. alder85J TaxID=2862949 RepID=UPI001CD6BEC4|nr:NmrA family NAD(P)-binding protein [Nocardia sp. alder85J]MCX4095691.1 NmrA family NAD(P)-binding protein [Nocardia sp. alder85J]
MDEPQVVMVTGATGAQGGAAVDALLGAGRSVRALVRDPASEAAVRLAERGVQLCAGSFDDVDAVRTAVDGADGVFSMQLPPHPKDLDSERRAAETLVRAAEDANVRMFVHTSVARAGDHAQFAGWDENRWWQPYWTSKAAANDVVRSSSLERWVILKPAYMMDNFVPPKADLMFPQLAKGEITTAMAPETRLDLIAAADIGRVAAAAFADSAHFDRQEIDLAAESLTMSEVAAVLTQITGRTVRARHLDPEGAVAAGSSRGPVQNHQWLSAEGYRVDLSQMPRWGFHPVTFADWATEHASDLVVGQR